ncbi:hypothetical protein SHI21_12755 [Bacteriovorax sp. PP10]|uniref:Lipoprotein n=1 Tax=Bacteriovorax antarcticus TaxID=3088717 RepID=A0ABU5VVV7_9BACT|nr:hypothetical protein [Bacteriovorax sp. PP10]MEA9357087.1 hypothetical protein [Bacteriovorax sp. PP10]
MKNLMKTSLFMTLVLMMAVGCQQKTSTNKKSSSTSNSSTGTGTIDLSTGNQTLDGCDGVYRADATSCYRSDIPTFTLSGTSTSTGVSIGPVLWSSRTSLPSTYSQNSFVTDATFKVRIKPSYPNANARSAQGRLCSGPMAYNFTRVKVYLMLRRTIDSITTYKEITAKVGAYSTKTALSIPGGTTEPYILEVVGIATDHRCNAAYGSLSANEKAACTAGTYWGSIPLVVSSAYPDALTSCAGITLEYSTDSTYDLP